MIINQWIPAAHYGDAVGNSARVVRDLLRNKGYVSNIFALTIDEELQGDVRLFSEPEATSGDTTILHFAVPSPMSEALALAGAEARAQAESIAAALGVRLGKVLSATTSAAPPPSTTARSTAAKRRPPRPPW